MLRFLAAEADSTSIRAGQHGPDSDAEFRAGWSVAQTGSIHS